MNYQLYIILFPKLIAGPIIRYSQIADQITNRFETFRYQHAIRGFHRFCIGLSKKVIIANAVGQYADLAFSSDLSNLSSGVAWLGMLAYTMQIYFDFSGYSDMAIGLGQMMGFRFPENFDNPYTSRSITEFWRRWHITLGTWMKNYLYIPLGGNRVASTSRLFFNLWIVFILSGFWHGASWTFIAWGAFHGLFLILDRLGLKKILDTIGTISSILFSFLIINIGWVFFRANSITDAFHYLKALVSFNRTETAISCNYNEFYFTLIIAVVFSFFIVCKPFKKLHDYVYYRDLSILATVSVTIISLFAFAICVSLITASSFNPFIYFRF